MIIKQSQIIRMKKKHASNNVTLSVTLYETLSKRRKRGKENCIDG